MKSLVLILTLFTCIGLIANPATQKRTDHTTVNRFIVPSAELRTGDLVFRNGKGFISDMFRRLSPSQLPWSHAGIVVMENGKPMVFHVMGHPELNRNGIRREPLFSFCNSLSNSGYAIVRYGTLQGKGEQIKQYLQKQKSHNVRFDDHFRLDTDHELYCTELIYKMLLAVTGEPPEISQFKGEPYVSVDNLFRNPGAVSILENHY